MAYYQRYRLMIPINPAASGRFILPGLQENHRQTMPAPLAAGYFQTG